MLSQWEDWQDALFTLSSIVSPKPAVRNHSCVLALLLVSAVSGCAVQQVAPPNPLPALPTVFTDANRVVAPSNEVPAAVNFKSTTQLKLQATQHWAKIAEDAVRSITAPLRKAGKCESSFDPCKAVYVTPPTATTEFGRAFYSQVLTTLVRSELPVAKTPQSDFTLDIEVQPIAFSPNRPQYRYAGVASQLGPGVWALRDVGAVDPADAGVVPPTVDALHWFRSEFASGRTPQIEILVTLSVVRRDRYLARTTNAYYIEDGDRHLYEIKPIPVTSTPSTPATPATPATCSTCSTNLRVVGDCPLGKCVADANGVIEMNGKVKGARK